MDIEHLWQNKNELPWNIFFKIIHYQLRSHLTEIKSLYIKIFVIMPSSSQEQSLLACRLIVFVLVKICPVKLPAAAHFLSHLPPPFYPPLLPNGPKRFQITGRLKNRFSQFWHANCMALIV